MLKRTVVYRPMTSLYTVSLNRKSTPFLNTLLDMRKEEVIKDSGPDVSHDVALNSGVNSAAAEKTLYYAHSWVKVSKQMISHVLIQPSIINIFSRSLTHLILMQAA